MVAVIVFHLHFAFLKLEVDESWLDRGPDSKSVDVFVQLIFFPS